MDNAPSFTPSILKSQASNVDIMVWDSVLDAWKKKDYLATVHNTLKYVNPAVFKKYGNKERTVFRIPHGSVIINIEIRDNKVFINAPFLKIGNAQKVPLFRQVAQLNFTPLRLAQIYLEDDQLTFYGECELELCEPYKFYDILREICINADTYDDQFIENFGAEHIHEPEVTPYSSEQLDKIWTEVIRIVGETREYVKYFEEKRWHGSAWDILNCTLKRIDFYIAPQGNVRNEIEKNIGFMQAKGDLMQQIDVSKKMLDKIESDGKEKFLQDVYKVEIFIPYKSIGQIQSFKNQLKGSHERATKERNEGNYMMATITCLYAFYHLFYSYNVLDDTTDFINKSLKRASGAPWKKSSATLWTAMNDIMVGRHIPRMPKSGGILSSLFGK